MNRNVDLIAIGVLLAGIAVYASTRNCIMVAVSSHRLTVMPYPHVTTVPMPQPPPFPDPPVRFMRD